MAWKSPIFSSAATAQTGVYSLRNPLGRRLDKLRRRYEQAHLKPSLLWLLTLIEHYVRPDGARSRIGHIIVDEAQDVATGEWLNLWAMNDADAWTILGDLNQRRTDNTLTTWSDISNAVGLPSATTPIRLKLGYRSTERILQFANRLLPPDNRPPPALRREGKLPEIVGTVREHLGRNGRSTGRATAIDVPARHGRRHNQHASCHHPAAAQRSSTAHG